MEFKKILISIVIMITIIGSSTQCSAKYVIEYTKKAAEITIKT